MPKKYPCFEKRALKDLDTKQDVTRVSCSDTLLVLARQIRDFNILQPPTLNVTTGRILHGRLVIKALRDQGEDEMFVWCVEVAKEKEHLAYFALNNHAGEWDWKQVSLRLQEMEKLSRDLILTGFHESDLIPLKAADWINGRNTAMVDQEAQTLFNV